MPNYHETSYSTTNADAAEFSNTLHAHYGRPVESLKSVHPFMDVENLHADPSGPLELCPDASGTLTVHLPFPDKAGTVFPSIRIYEGTDTTFVETTIAAAGDGLYLSREREILRKDGSRALDYVGLRPLNILAEEISDAPHKLNGSEAEIVLDFVKHMKPHSRRRPISLFNLSKFGENIDLLEERKSDAEQFSEAVHEQFRSIGSSGHNIMDLGPFHVADVALPKAVGNLIGAKHIRLWQQSPDEALLTSLDKDMGSGMQQSKLFEEFPKVTLKNDVYLDGDDVTVYTTNNRVYARRGPKPVPSERYTLAVMGHTIMDVVTTPVYGEPATPLNPQQVAGVINILQSSVPAQKEFIGFWAEL